MLSKKTDSGNTRTLTTKKGKECVTSFTDEEAIEVLSKLVADTGLAFGAKLLRQLEQPKGLSPDQIVWVHILANGEPQKTISVPRIQALFDNANKSGLKRVSLTFKQDEVKVQFRLAGRRSKYFGSILVTDGGSYGSNKWYGTITGGECNTARSVVREVTDAVAVIEADPVKAAKLSAKLDARCCFCGRDLTTKESIGVGYGPVCAANFGLAWGSEQEYDDKKESLFQELEGQS